MHDEIHQALTCYLNAYFSERDLKSTLQMFTESCSGFGTGRDEKYFNFEDMKTFYTRDIQQAPGSINFKIYNLKTEFIPNCAGYSACQLDIQLHLEEQELKLNHIRLSVFWTKKGTNWQVMHMHISFPTDAHEGDESYPIKELEERNTVLQRLVDERTEKLNIALKEITLLATTDKLTGLCNRHRIEEFLEQEIKRSKRYDNKLSIILVDIDWFKMVNDTYGHQVGDNVLVEFSLILSNQTRTTDLCGRWGGEEFLIVCIECSEEETIQIAEKIRITVESYKFDTIDHKTASFGVASLQPHQLLKDLVKSSDDALYQAKKSGRNQVVSFRNISTIKK